VKKTGIVVSLVVALACCWVLFSNNDVLDVELPFAFPAGNLIAAALLIAASSLAVLLAVRGTRLHAAARAILLLSIAWLPVSMAIAGGVQLSYSGWQGWLWIAYTCALLVAIPVVVAWALVATVVGRRKAAGA
jgi:hypothetical protein